jgi:hypothetical protein
MTSDGPYPPGFEPDGAPYARYPAEEQNGRGSASGPARATPGAWAPPPDDRFAPPSDQYAAQSDRFGETGRFAPGGDWPAQPGQTPGYPAPGYAAAAPGSPVTPGGSPAPGRPGQGSYPAEASYGGDRPGAFGQPDYRQADLGSADYDRGTTYGQPSYGPAGQDRPAPPGAGGWPADQADGAGWQPDGPQSGYGTPGGGFGPGAVPRPPEPARGPEQGWPGDPTRQGSSGRVSGSATVGGAPVGGSFGGTPIGAPMGSPPVSGPGASPGSPVGGPTGRAPGVYGTPTQYGTPRYGDEDASQPPFGGGHYGGGQYGDRAGQYGGGNQPGQYGANPANAQYGVDAITRFRPDGPQELDRGPEEPPAKSRRGLIIGLAIAAVVVVALVAVAVVVAMSGSKTDYAVGSCVKQDGDKAVATACSDSAAFSVVNSVDQPTKCADQTQPYVVVQRSGKSAEVLCLKPAH